MSYTKKASVRFDLGVNGTMKTTKVRNSGSSLKSSLASSTQSGCGIVSRRVCPATVKRQQVSGEEKHISSKSIVLSKSPNVCVKQGTSVNRTPQNTSTKYVSLRPPRAQEETARSVSQRHTSSLSASLAPPRARNTLPQKPVPRLVSPPRSEAHHVSLIPMSPRNMSQKHVSTKTIMTQTLPPTEPHVHRERITQQKSSSPARPTPQPRASLRSVAPRHVPVQDGTSGGMLKGPQKRDNEKRTPPTRKTRSQSHNQNYTKISNAPVWKNVSKNVVVTECYLPPVKSVLKRRASPDKSKGGAAAAGPSLVSPGLVSRVMRTPRQCKTMRRSHIYSIKVTI